MTKERDEDDNVEVEFLRKKFNVLSSPSCLICQNIVVCTVVFVFVFFLRKRYFSREKIYICAYPNYDKKSAHK